MAYLFDKTESVERPQYSIIPRAYQHDALDGCFRVWDDTGERGALIRLPTGTGKTICACMCADRWLQRGDDYRVMIISYEKQLVWQFAQEIEDVLGIKPGIEMEREEVDATDAQSIIVASRQTLVLHKPLSQEQRLFFHQHGYGDDDIGLCTFRLGARLIRAIKREADSQFIADELEGWNRNYRCDHESGLVSRLHKFDWRRNWLVCFDEAHRHVATLKTVGHIVEWFDRNPTSRRLGTTATPKRADGISIGSKMFPGIACDYPLYRVDGRSAVRDGYAVRYVQKYIQVDSVDFAEIKELAGTNIKKWDAEVAKRLETELATFCEPLLDLVEDRLTLIFSPSVSMARQVADYINARAKCRCVCGKTQWHAASRIEDGAKCKACERFLTHNDVLQTPEMQAHALWGDVPAGERKPIYEGHQQGEFQFLSVCGLCREGYNSPSVACVALFRPVSKAASGLAEQMKGRGSRPLRGLIDGLETAEERLQAIASSDKPYCLIVDLTGATGHSDCATTAAIYAEGESDEVVARADEILSGGVEDVDQAVRQAREDVVAARERKRKARERREELAREAARQRARARAEVKYTEHDIGYGSSKDGKLATAKQINFIRMLGMELIDWEPTKRQAGRIIDQLMRGEEPTQVVYSNGINDTFWRPSYLSNKQKWMLYKLGAKYDAEMSPYAASKLIDRLMNGGKVSVQEVTDRIALAQTAQQLDRLSREVRAYWGRYTEDEKAVIRNAGFSRRATLREEF